jgi:hypothetical protein
MIPASIAAWPRSSCWALTPKYVSAAAWMPYAWLPK